MNLTENFMPYATDGHRHLPEIEQELRRLGVAVDAPISFVPHLLPVDQGLLASCYVELASEIEADELASLYSELLRGRAVRRGRGDAARRARGARHEPLPDPPGEARGRARA